MSTMSSTSLSEAAEFPDPPDPDLRAVGDRIEMLLEASSAAGSVARERAEELVRLVADLYGAGLQRMLEILDEAGVLSAEVLGALARDDLVASLLLVHGLHPLDVSERVQGALDSVRPYLASHGGDVELLGITDEGVARLRLLGSCDGCASSSVTMSLAVKDAITEAAPEISGFDVESPRATAAGSAGRGLIPLEVLPRDGARDRPDDGLRRAATPATAPGRGTWVVVPDIEALAAGELVGRTVGGVAIVVCRVGSDMFAFRDACARCGAALDDAVLARRMGAPAGSAVLQCRSCGSHYDVRAAGSSIDEGGRALVPFPLLGRHGRVEVAVPTLEPR